MAASAGRTPLPTIDQSRWPASAQVIDIRAEMGAVETTHTNVDDASSQPGTVVGRDRHPIGDLRQHFWPEENTGLHDGTQADG